MNLELSPNNMQNEMRFNPFKLLNLFYIGLILLWDPIQRIFGFDGAGRTVVLMTSMVLLLNSVFDRLFLKNYIFSSPIFVWLIWVLYSVLNLKYEGYNGELSFLIFCINQLLTPLVVMILTAKESVRDNIGVLKYLVIIFSIYAILSITVLSSSDAVVDGRSIGALGNIGPLVSLYIAFYSALLFAHNRIGIPLFLAFLTLSFSVVIPSETRKAFSAEIIILIFFLLSQFRLTYGRVIVSLLGVGIMWAGIDYALNSTNMAQRFQESVDQAGNWNTSGIKALDLLGDRAKFYIDGWDIFLDNPINGIGLQNYYNLGYGQYAIHSEYMVQLAESGLIGFFLFALFNSLIARNIYLMNMRSEFREVGMVLAGGFVATLFIGLTAWTYQFAFYFSVFGVIIAHLKISKMICSKSKSVASR